MEERFFNLYSRHGSLMLEVGHNSVADWNVIIYDRKGKAISECDKPAINVQESDRSIAFARAYVELTDYLSEHRGGY